MIGSNRMLRLGVFVAAILYPTFAASLAHAQASSAASKPAEAATVARPDTPAGKQNTADKVDDYIKTQMQRQHLPGLSLAVVRDGKIIKAKGYGLANVETNTPATPETVYKIASISKQFLAAGVMLLVQDGKLGLDDKISKYLDGTPETWKDITIRHLLTHTSGIVREAPGFDPFKVQPDADVIKAAYPLPLRFPSGEKWEYCNVGYYSLAEIIHKVSGKSWSEFLCDRLFAPAGMTATRTTTTTDIVPQRASGYKLTRFNGDLKNAENWLALRPSGAFLSTVLDLAKWDTALYSDAVLSSSIREQMWTPVKLNKGTTHPYGFGWSLDPWQGHKRVHHGGGLPGFQSAFERFVEDKLTVIVLINTSSAELEKIAFNVAGLYVPALAPPVLKAIPDPEPQLTAKVKTMIAGFVGGNLDMSLFMPKAAPDKRAKSGISDILRSPGAIQSIVLVEHKNQGDNRTCRYRVMYQNYSLFVVCTFNKDDKITGFFIEPD